MKPAIKELMNDHQTILRMLRALNGMCLRLGEGKPVTTDDLGAALDFIKVFADYAHHGKEEDLLFPAMEEAGFPRDGGPIAVMLMEHAQGRAYVQALAAALERVRAGETAALKDAARAASGYSALLSAHIGKEDNILYPMAMEALPEARWETLKTEFARIEAERMGPQRRAVYEALVERLLAAYPAPELARPAGGMCH
ncbi:MAG: hemerythrin domain-containing protein [Elusimicrobiota bacterium]|nr:hemerythrin domain-containing protein [Elusimicrobiota bacterium]